MCSVLLGLLAFLLTAAESYVVIRGRQATAARRAAHAANWDVALELLLFVDIVLIIEARWIIVPIVFGAWLGTYLSVKHSQGDV